MPSNQERGIDTPKAKGPTGNNHLLVIAIDDYAHCPKLSNCVKDAKDFAQLLWERYQFDEAHTYFLLDQAATRPNILNTIRDLRMQVKEADSLVIYYSGHGQTVDDVGYWIPVDAAPDSEVDFVSTLELKPRLDAINSFHTFLIADACFSGALFLQFKDTPVAAGEDKRSRWGLAASHSREKALDGTPGENSPFSERLLKNLRNNTESLGIQKLAGKLIDEVFVTSDRKQTPVFKPLNVKGDDSGQFVFKLRKEDEDSVWAEALAGKSAVSIKKYLSRYPTGVYATVAHGLLKDLEEESEWERVLATDSIDALLDFIDRFPQGRLRKQARERIDLLEDNQDWQRATSSNRIADYLEYKEKHPNGRNIGEADRRIGAIRTQQREADAWRKAQNEHSERGYRRYLEEYPEGLYVARARSELEGLRDREGKEAARQKEESAWAAAKGSGSMDALERYLREYPDGRYRSEAEAKIAGLKKPVSNAATSAAGPAPATPPSIAQAEGSRPKATGLPRWLPYALGALVVAVGLFVWIYSPGSNNREVKVDDVTYSSSVGGELKDYNAAIAAQTIPALEGYLRRYPEGTNAARIKVNLKSLNGKVDSCLKDAELFIQMGYLGDAKALLDTAGKINPDDPRIQVLLKKAR